MFSLRLSGIFFKISSYLFFSSFSIPSLISVTFFRLSSSSAVTFTLDWLISPTRVTLGMSIREENSNAARMVFSVLGSLRAFTTTCFEGTFSMDGLIKSRTEHGAFLVISLAIDPT